MTTIATPKKWSPKGRILITKERKSIAEHAERNGNAPFTIRDARGIMRLTTLASARDTVDRLVSLQWAEKAERPKYARNGEEWFRLTRGGVEAILGASRAQALFSKPVEGWEINAATPVSMVYKAAERPLYASDTVVEIAVANGTLRIPLSDVRKVYDTLHALVGHRSEG